MKVHEILSPGSFNSSIRSHVKSSDIILICYNRYNIAHELTDITGTVI